jgi:hypothetical protein
MDRNSSNRREFLSDAEIEKRAFPGGLMPSSGLKPADNRNGNGWQNISAGSPAAVAGAAERQFRHERPDVAARRMAKGK